MPRTSHPLGASVLALQAQAGNAAVAGLLTRHETADDARSPSDPVVVLRQAHADAGRGHGDRDASLHAADERAVDEIRQLIPGPAVEPVIAFAHGTGVSGRQILQAIHAGGSDPLLTATAFVTLRSAGEATADLILRGQVHVAPMPDSINGAMAAAYSAAPTTTSDGITPLTEADTLYIRPGTSIDDPMDRSYIVHEATHALQDASLMAGTHLDAEVEAYQEQARYMYGQLNAVSGPARAGMVRSFAAGLSSSLQAALLETAIASPDSQPAFVDIMAARPGPGDGDPHRLLAVSRDAAIRNLRRVISGEYGEAAAGTDAGFQGVGRGR
jgi:hypothetical protein